MRDDIIRENFPQQYFFHKDFCQWPNVTNTEDKDVAKVSRHIM